MEPKLFMELFADEYVKALSECWSAHDAIKSEMKRIMIHSSRFEGGEDHLADYLKLYGRSFGYWHDRITKLKTGPLGLYLNEKGVVTIDLSVGPTVRQVLDKLIFEVACRSSEITGFSIKKFLVMYKLQSDLILRKKGIINSRQFFRVAENLFGHTNYHKMLTDLLLSDKSIKVSLIFNNGLPKITSWETI